MYVGMPMRGAVQHLTHFFLQVRTEEVEEEGGQTRREERAAGSWVSKLGTARVPSFRS